MNATTTRSLAKKVAALLPKLEAQGKLYFFALGERADDQWNAIVSSEWSDKNYAASVRFVADDLAPRLTPTELMGLAGILIVPSNEPDIMDLPEELEKVSPERIELVDLTLMGEKVRRAFVFKARRPSEAVLSA